MVSHNGRNENIRKNGPDRDDGGRGSRASDRAARLRQLRYPTHSPASNPVGKSGLGAVGAPGSVAGTSLGPVTGRAGASAGASAVGNSLSKNLFIAGGPDSGKTALVRDAALAKKSRVGGFYMESIMSGRVRKGLMIRTLDGQDRMLASKTVKSNHMLEKFPVDLNALENVGVPALRLALMTKDMIVIDELGTLEGMSQRFKETLMECLQSSKPVLATIRSTSSKFTDELKKMPSTQIIVLKSSNKAVVRNQIRKWMEGQL